MTQPPTAGAALIIGAGLGGLFLALKLAPRPAIVLSPAPLGEGAASAWAQGGLAAALGPADAPDLHAADTIAAGAGLVDPVVAHLIAEEGPARVMDLLAIGVPFDRTPEGALALSLEAAHSQPRVARVKGDLAGQAIMQALIAAVRAASHIQVIEGLRMHALLQDGNGAVCGALCVDRAGAAHSIAAADVVLATGGTGGLFAVTTNPASAVGDGLAAAYRAGALLADMEFVQFHPTAITLGLDPAPLATEALRGEGARLVDEDGTPFMEQYHPQAELAPRDVVARAIHAQLLRAGGAHLDARAAIGAHFPEAFPSVFAACMSAGLDPRRDLIPIAPAAHYHMGGAASDLWGRSTVSGLSVLGECASTGAHGANRLASNSLLEAVVFAHRIALRLREDPTAAPNVGHAEPPPETPAALMPALRAAMGQHCGVLRNAAGLSKLCAQIDEWREIHGEAPALLAAGLMAQAALSRKESRGGHYREDYPSTDATPHRTFQARGLGEGERL